jgi:hypothetical protein
MMPKSGNRFSDKIMRKQNVRQAQWFNLSGSLSSGGGLESPAAAQYVSGSL